MKRIFLLFLGFSTYVFAQNDSFLSKESERLEMICKRNGNNPDSLNYYGTKLLKLGKEYQDNHALVEGYFFLSQAKSLEAKTANAIIYLDSALAYKDLIKNESIIYRLLRTKAMKLTQNDEFDKAEILYKEIIDRAQKLNQREEIAHSLNGLGMIERRKNNHEKSLSFYNEALHIWDSLGNINAKLGLLSNIGIAQKQLGDIESSNATFQKSIALEKNNKRDQRTLYRLYSNLATNFIATKSVDSANFYLDKVISYYKKSDQKFELALAYMNKGESKIGLKEMDSASYFFNKSLKIIKSQKNIHFIIENYRLLATVFLKKDDFDKALIYVDSAHNLSIKNNYKSGLEHQYALYAEINEKKEDYEQAILYLRKNDSIKKAKLLKGKSDGLDQTFILEDIKDKNRKIKTLSTEKSFYMSNLFIIVFVAFILFVMSLLLYRKRLQQKRSLKELQEKLNNYNKTNQIQYKSELLLKLKSNAVLNSKEILYVKSDGHYLEIFSENKEKPEIERSSLTTFLEKLPKQDFIRIHKSHIVNIHKIKIINSTQVMLENGEWIKLSRTYKQELKDILNKK